MIYARINQLLEERNKSLYWLAKHSGVKYQTLWQLKRGKTKAISFDVLEKICRTFECQPGDLLVMVQDETQADCTNCTEKAS